MAKARARGAKLPEYADRLNAASWLLDYWAERDPHRPAIHFGGQWISYRGLGEQVNRAGNALLKLGLAQGQRFVICLPNRPEAAIALLAGIKIGATPVASFHFLKPPELRTIIEATDAVGLISAGGHDFPDLDFNLSAEPGGDLARLMAAQSPHLEAADTGADDSALLCFTSGTTGSPKGLPYRHRAILGVADVAVPEGLAGLGAGDVVFSTSPFGFSFGLAAMIFYPFRYGAAVVYEAGRLEAEEVLAILQAHRVSHFFTVPTLCQAMLEVADAARRFDLSQLRVLKVGGMQTPVRLQEDFKAAFGIDILPGFGLAEAAGSALTCFPDRFKYGSIGLPQPHCEARIVDAQRAPLEDGEHGRLAIKAPYLIRQYWRAPEKSRECLDDAGWFYTDDLAYRDGDGFYYHVGRIDEMIISAGWTISPGEVEDVLGSHPAIADLAVFALPDADKGSVPAAALVLAPGATLSEEALKRFAGERLAPYKYPRRLVFARALPKTPTGKTARHRLAEMFAAELLEN